ncbi:MAG: phosphatase PAP2 family protein [Candidatus Marsarchaeota archaeon]|nr:phosphatase PAP2 family protein [Candidatus Marsarchaeota archaeon]
MEPISETFLLFSRLINNDLIFTASVLLLAYLAARRPADSPRRAHLVAALMAAFLLSMLLKPLIVEPRPCWLGLPSLVACPSDYSMPSTHAAVAFALAFALIRRRSFPPFLLFALLVAGSRLFLGVHTLPDVAGGMAVALLAVALADRAVPDAAAITPAKKMAASARAPTFAHVSDHHSELARKILQIIIGIALLALVMAAGVEPAIMLLFAVLAAGSLLFHLKARGHALPLIDSLLLRLERPGAAHGEGAMSMAAGLLMGLTLLPLPLAQVSIILLSLSDSAAALAGRGQTLRLPHHPQKSYLGSAAFIAAALPAYFLAGWDGLLMVFIAAMLESLPSGIDDNLLMPLSGLALLLKWR